MKTNPSLKPRGLNALLTLTAIVLAVLGGGLFAVPRLMATFYGATVSADGTNAARTAGAAILALGLLAWRTRRHKIETARAIGIPVLFVWFVMKSVVAYLGVMHRVFDSMIGATVLFFDVLLAATYGYYLLRPATPPPKYDRESPSSHPGNDEKQA